MSSEGYWGPRTATIDWCESNYVITHYVAEFWNTISNFIMIVFPLYGVYWSYSHIKYADKLRQTSPNKFHNQFKIPNSVLACLLGLALVGIGSWCFHMTLLYPMQLLDELPMIYGSAILIYAEYDLILSINESTNPKKLNRTLAAALILLYCLIVTFIYLSVWKNPVFHELAYGLMVFVIMFESFHLIRKLKASKVLYVTSLGYYVLGFIFWNLDNNFCEYLKTCKDFLQATFGIDGENNLKSIFFNSVVIILKSVFEFHSWWHLFTGYAAYMTILFIIDLNYRHHLQVSNQMESVKESHKPVASKFASCYYFLTNRLIEDNPEKIC